MFEDESYVILFPVVHGEEEKESKFFVVFILINLNIFWISFQIVNIGDLNRLQKFGYNE